MVWNCFFSIVALNALLLKLIAVFFVQFVPRILFFDSSRLAAVMHVS